MYRVLIVDDEPIIVEGLYDMLQQQEEVPCEVLKAGSAPEALEIARLVRIDVLLTDIEMPVMNGLALQQEMSRLWPKCKTIFLTGYSDFHYVQSSLRSGAFDYVLKREEDRKVLQVVAKAIDAIAADSSADRLLHEARNRMHVAMPALRRDYLLDLLLNGPTASPESRSARFAELGIALRGGGSVHLVIGRVDSWPAGIRPGDKPLYLFGVGNIAEEQFAGKLRVQFVTLPGDRFLLLMQTEDGVEIGEAYLLGTLESIQSACRTYLKITCSFAAGCEPCDWNDAAAKYERLSFRMANGLGLGSESLLADSRHDAAAPAAYGGQLTERNMSLLSQALERKDRDAFEAKFAELAEAVCERGGDLRSGDALALFYALSAMFMLFLNRHGLFTDMMAKVKLNKLLSIEEHASLEEALLFYRGLAHALFASASEASGIETSDVVRRVNEYIQDHIGGDLSLTRLTEIVHLTPSYLSRLYKQQTRQSLTDFIMQARLDKAKELLAGSHKKIYQIGFELGFQSAPYFNRLFKKAVSMTPQEYRDLYGTAEV
ncbi:MAG: response regulator [Paenibacillaceae bacterium]|nr:response regulator [Paenibacillaceae bacterium]